MVAQPSRDTESTNSIQSEVDAPRVSVSTGNRFAALHSLLVDLVRGIPVALKLFAMVPGGKVRDHPTFLAGPAIRLMQPSEHYGVTGTRGRWLRQ